LTYRLRVKKGSRHRARLEAPGSAC
jgi:hypothetical protein